MYFLTWQPGVKRRMHASATWDEDPGNPSQKVEPCDSEQETMIKVGEN